MDSSVIDTPTRDAVETQALSWPDRARALTIADAASYTEASDFLKTIKMLRGQADAIFDPPIKAAHDSHRAAIDAKRKVETPLLEAEKLIKSALVRYDDAQERIRREEQRRREDEERRRLEEDRINLAAHMEREGHTFGDAGLVQEAEELIAAPIVPVVPAVPKATPAVAGQHFTVTWSAQVVNLIELVRFVAANPSHIGLLTANQPALNAQARSLKEHLALPGVRPVGTKNVASRR